MGFTSFLSIAVATAATFLPSVNGQECSNIAEIACSLDDFSTLCTAVTQAGLAGALSGDDALTVFAPTNEAFANLGAILDAVLDDPVLLTDILLFHVVSGKVLADDLECSKTITALNGQDSRTICHANGSDGLFQKGGSNPRSNLPEIVVTDIEACNGVIHVVDEVLLPQFFITSGPDFKPEMPETPVEPEVTEKPEEPEEPAEPEENAECQSIADIACGLDDFSTLCTAVKVAGLAGALSGDDKLTVFAPTNAAFAELGPALDAALEDIDLLTRILLLHVTPGEVFSTDLACTKKIPTLQGQKTRTVCLGHAGSDGIFQKGAGNDRADMPQIVVTDIAACNGVIHVVDGVILPGTHE